MNKVETIFIVFICIFLLSACRSDKSEASKSYGVFIGASREETLKKENYDLLIVEAYNLDKDDIEALHKNNNKKVYTYLNIGSVEEFRDFYENFKDISMGAYENWEEEHWVDVRKKEWQEHILKLAKEYKEKGVDGFFIDNTDVYSNYKNDEIYEAVADILDSLSEPGLPLIINGGDEFVKKALEEGRLSPIVKGVNQETVFTAIDFENSEFKKADEEVKSYYTDYLGYCREKKLDIYLLEYTADEKLKKEIEKYCNENKHYFYISDSLELS